MPKSRENKGKRIVISESVEFTMEVVVTGVVKDGQVVDMDYSFHPCADVLAWMEQSLIDEAEYAGGEPEASYGDDNA